MTQITQPNPFDITPPSSPLIQPRNTPPKLTLSNQFPINFYPRAEGFDPFRRTPPPLPTEQETISSNPSKEDLQPSAPPFEEINSNTDILKIFKAIALLRAFPNLPSFFLQSLLQQKTNRIF